MVLSDAIGDYSQFARHELGHSPNTYHAYVSWQRNFARWLADNGMPDPPVKEISGALIRRWSYYLSGGNRRPRTVRSALHAIRALFRYLAEHNVLPSDPSLEVRLPKKDAATRLLVTDEDLIKLLEAAERQRSDYRAVRDRAVLSVLIFCALRRQELIDLTVGAVNLNDRSLLVQHGKGNKSRTIFLCDEAVEAIREWLALRQGLGCRHDFLFVTDKQRRFGENALAAMLEEVKAIAGFKGDARIKPHSIRHAAATRLLRNGADLRSIQTWLGHSQLETTAIYLHTDEQQVRKIAPLAALRPPSSDGPVHASGSPETGRRRRRLVRR
jgi:site-specific recombinase XerD